MAVMSMTGFGRASGQDGGADWVWEIRTVNGRGLDIRMRLPAGLEDLEVRIRDILVKRLSRGNCAVALTLRGAAAEGGYRLNEDALRQLAALAARACEIAGHDEKIPVANLLGVKGVIETAEGAPGEGLPPALRNGLAESFGTALDELVSSRLAEGARLKAILLEKIDEIENGARQAEISPERSPAAVAARIRQQIERLLGESSALDENRLHQEAVLIAARADIEEELKRLHAHVHAARDLLNGNAPSGRRLEFLAQEFQREANTLCSKSSGGEITRIGLGLKAAIDQFREQVQNVE